ncbi:MAG: nucleotidyltransferase domain-containing protein [Oscillospiraceae bacterium]|nr:nucleotidyltransferase domain-containing protein [Oscillospiraceae bacterium]
MNNERQVNIIFNKNGNGFDSTKINLPLPWIKELGITRESKQVRLIKEGNKIIIEREANHSNETMKILQEYVVGLQELLQENLQQVILYGSYARGDYNEDGEMSDVDVMILLNMNENEISEVADRIIEYTYETNLQNNILISPVVESVETYQDRANWMPYYKSVRREGVMLYGVQREEGVSYV